MKGSRLRANCVSNAGPGSASDEDPDAAPPTGATSRRGTVVSLPDGNRTGAYCVVACTSSTSSTTGSYFEEHSWRLRYIGPGVLSQVGTEIPNVERRRKLKKRSKNVVLHWWHGKVKNVQNATHQLGQFATVQYLSYETSEQAL